MDSDQRAAAATRQSQAGQEPPNDFGDIRNMRRRLRQMANAGKNTEELNKLLAETEPILEYMESRDAIEAAGAKLEEHRAEFERLLADEQRFLDFAFELFSRETFAPLRFSASDVRRAFDRAGHPGTLLPDERTAKALRAAVLSIADKERRAQLSMRPLLHLPEFVAAGRFLEAWLLQEMAFETIENQEENNAFLFQMFTFGYDALAAEKRARGESALRQLGLDPEQFRGMSPDEFEAWIQSQAADPAKTAALETFLRDNPEARAESEENLEAMTRISPQLLEREDSRFLLLSREETKQWVTTFEERYSQASASFKTPALASPEEANRKMINDVMIPLMQEMAVAIFNKDRIMRLVADLKRYRSERFAAGDKAAYTLAMGAITYLEREDSPGQNVFLITLCWSSVISAIKEMVPQTEAAGE